MSTAHHERGMKGCKKNLKIIAALIVCFFMALSFFVTALGPMEKDATSKVLILQQQAVNFDPYTAAKSSEKIGRNLTKIIPTTLFFESVLAADPTLPLLSDSEEVQRKIWSRKVDVSMAPETSVMTVRVYDRQPETARQWVQAVTAVLEKEGKRFHGGGEFVTMTTIDEPLVSRWPTRPNLMTRLAMGLLVGVSFALWFIRKTFPGQLSLWFPWKDWFEGELESPRVVVEPASSEPVEAPVGVETFQPVPATPSVAATAPIPIAETIEPNVLDYTNFQEPMKSSSHVLHALHDFKDSEPLVYSLEEDPEAAMI